MAQDINAEFQRLQQLATSLRKDFSSFNLFSSYSDSFLTNESISHVIPQGTKETSI